MGLALNLILDTVEIQREILGESVPVFNGLLFGRRDLRRIDKVQNVIPALIDARR